jgi:hypothetical protein
MKNNIENVGVLDLTGVNQENSKNIGEIKNVGILLYTKENKEYVMGLPMKNVGASFEVGKNLKIVTGNLTIEKDYFQNFTSQMSLVVAGRLTVSKGVKAEDIDKYIEKMIVAGEVLCDEDIYSVINNKITVLSGTIRKINEKSKFTLGKLKIDNSYLNSLESGTKLTVVGKIEFTGDFDINLFEEKVDSIELTGKAVLLDKYSKKVLSRLNGTYKTDIIPEGFDYYKNDVIIDNSFLRKLSKNSIYTKGNIIFTEEVDCEKIADKIKKIYAGEKIFCSQSCEDSVLKIISDDSSLSVYKGNLIVAEGSYELTESELEYGGDALTYIVTGMLSIDNNVKIETFMKKVSEIHNFGMIECSSEIYGPVQLKIKTRTGVLLNKDREQEKSFSNAGYVKF